MQKDTTSSPNSTKPVVVGIPNRSIKFRLWNPDRNVITGGNELNTLLLTTDGDFVKEFNNCKMVWMQFTGFEDIYEGDIFREEIDGNLGDVDEIYYSVVTWIKEWCMFACLVIKNELNEYQNYLLNGAEALDESMFWTFPLQNEKYGRRYLAGNIFQNPELLG